MGINTTGKQSEGVNSMCEQVLDIMEIDENSMTPSRRRYRSIYHIGNDVAGLERNGRIRLYKKDVSDLLNIVTCLSVNFYFIFHMSTCHHFIFRECESVSFFFRTHSKKKIKKCVTGKCYG
jgi:hypothetical protein